jgi:hypothetical protein
MDILKKDGGRSALSAVAKLAFKIKAEAQLRLKGKMHIVTSRLRNSIYVKANPPIHKTGNTETYKNEPPTNGKYVKNFKQQTFDSDLKSVSVKETEFAIGTNVEYAPKIELMDSYLYWALKNVDIERSLAQDMKKDMENAMKFGKGIL